VKSVFSHRGQMMSVFPANVQVTQRMQVVDVTKIVVKGVLTDEFHDPDYSKDENSGWYVTDGPNIFYLSEWLYAFEGKDVIITIQMRNPQEGGASINRPMEDDE
jgi:hypothetical protein